ncbi:MAG: PEP-CTERM sorting domain-containing protein, partial [Planctomycetes bacterium]|nr:PEP-CTERM sorting domain-containing protein [Planctomycetota bacterium]
AMPVLGPFTLPDSFFVTNPAPPVVSGLLVDTSTQLEAFYSNGLTPLALDGVPTVVAVFTLLQGSGTIDFNGGNADVGGTLMSITVDVIPEPSTILLAGFGLLGVLATRRKLYQQQV